MPTKKRVLMLLAVLPCLAWGEPDLTLEQFGGQAYYKRFDGGLTYIPLTADPAITNGTGLPPGRAYTRIVYTGASDVFETNDLNMTFCGLFVHQNPGETDPTNADLYYPNIIGSRYSKVVHVIDGKNVIVDFEYNGKSKTGPLTVADQKGYLFFDNSAAWDLVMTNYLSLTNTQTRVRLREHSQTGMVQTVYVIPQYSAYSLRDKELRIWTGSGRKARVKLGVEDYFQWAGGGAKAYRQVPYLFKNNAFDRNIVIHNVVWIPPHRTVPEVSSFTRSFFGGPPTIGPCERILAVIGNTALDEKREIENGAGLTDESVQCMGLGFLYSGGKYAGSGVAEDITAYQYVFIKDFEHTGSSLVDLKANSGAGNYLVMQNVSTDFSDQEKWRPTSVLVDGRMTRDKTGFDTGLTARTYYPEEVFEITSGHSFHSVDNSYLLDGWGNAANIIQIDRFAFTIGNHGTWDTIYEQVYSEGLPKFDWDTPANAYRIRTGRKHMMVQRIPRAGSRYVISRDYTVSGGIPRTVALVSTNKVRGFANWSVILQKTLAQINPATDVPVHAKPIQLQAGDRFTLVGRGSDVYTVLDNDRGPYDQFNAEYSGANIYNYSRHTLNKNLPSDLPLAFEIDMVESTSEYLLDGAIRPAYLIYKSNVYWNSTTNTRFGDANVLLSDPLGHVSYNHRQFALWANNVQHNGFYRQSSNADGTLHAITDPDTGSTSLVSRLGRYSPGYVLIHSSGFQGQFCSGLNDFYVRDQIQRSLGLTIPEDRKAKIRLYHCSAISTGGVVGTSRFIESTDSDVQAPDMPAACRDLLNELPAWTPGFSGKMWNGFSGWWTNGACWTPEGAPGEGADVILPPGAYTVVLDGSSSNLNSYNQYGGILAFTNWTTALRAREVIVEGGTISHAPCHENGVTGTSNRVWIVATNMTLGLYGSVNADGRGFRGGVSGVLNHDGQGPGGAVHGTYGTAGGSYGGMGGDSYSTGYPRPAYGDPEAPVLPGSGGAGKDAAEGGAGGGAIRLEVGSRLTVNGTITANGGSGNGAGSGGGVAIQCGSVAGMRGVIRADGGRGTGTTGSGGGGGRVAILYDPAAQKTVGPGASVAVSCAHGAQDGYYSWAVNRDGKPGTVLFTDSQLMQTEIGDGGGGLYSWSADPGVLDVTGFSLVDTRAPFRADKDATHNFSAWVELPRVRTFAVTNDVRVKNAKLVLSNCVLRIGGGLTLTDSGRVFVFAGATNPGTAAFGALVAVTHDLLIASGGWVLPVSQGVNGGSVLFRCANLNIATTNAGFLADGFGYGSHTQYPGINVNLGYGPGGGGYRSGGGYGGRGGGPYPGETYGNPNAPAQGGSGGGYQLAGLGYNGGGLVWIEAAGAVNVDGSILARGEPRSGAAGYTGCGAGGGIFIRCADFKGSTNAVMSADGGNAASTGASGGGGRIAVWTRPVSERNAEKIVNNQLSQIVGSQIIATHFPRYLGKATADGGTIGSAGEAGSVVFLTIGRPPGMLMIVR